MDRSVDPGTDFYEYAAGRWMRENPVPEDKASWGAGQELTQRNYTLLREILEAAAAEGGSSTSGPRRQVGDFFASALDTDRRNALGFSPVRPALELVEKARSPVELFGAVSALHERGNSGVFDTYVFPDRLHSSTYAFYLYQGGLALPDREYYLADGFAVQRKAYLAHVERMFGLFGGAGPLPEVAAGTVMAIETELAKVARSATDLRDEVKNHNPFSVPELLERYPLVGWAHYLPARGIAREGAVVVGQPEFFEALESIWTGHSLEDWKTYLRWHVLHSNAAFLHEAAEQEHFDFFRRTLQGQPEPEPLWKRAAITIDSDLGEALGQLYVERHFPAEARARMAALVSDLQAVFRDRLAHLDWMTPETRAKALAKFDRFVPKIGHPERFRDYSSILIRRDEYAANHQRALAFEVRRQMARVGGPVDRSEWHMTPPTVNAYCSQTQNEIVFPAGILQPPFFDFTMDDAVNYGGIGAVIGHEITHGYDDQGRRFDADGNLHDWWTEADAREFTARAQVVIQEYNRQEALPGVHVNGELTLGENIADFGGVSIAFEALQRRLLADPSRRKVVDGLTPEQRFFISWAQIWRQNAREPERRRRLTVDPHSPGRSRAVVPLENLPEFYDAFPAGRPEGLEGVSGLRVRIW